LAKKKEAPATPEKPVAKKKDDKTPSRDERAAALMADVNKKFKGRASLMVASDYTLPYLTKRLPTGLLTLDMVLRGGFPAGGVSQVIGRRNAGKTLLMWLVVRQLQHLLGDDMKVLLAMTELQADRSQARSLGVQISMGQDYIDETNAARKAAGWPPLTKEETASLLNEVGTIHELHAMSAEDFYDVILRAIDENIYHLVVIDSIGNVLSAAEQENESVHDKTYGGAAAPNTTFLKKLTNLLTMKDPWGRVRDTCIIGINQVRDNIKDPHKQYKSPGGNLLEHAKLVDIWVESGKMLGGDVPTFGPEGWKQKFQATGKEVNWRIEKGKAGMHEGEKGTYVFDFSISNVDFYTDTLVAGVAQGVIEQAGGWLGIPDPAKPGQYLFRVNGRDAFIAALKQDAQLKAAANDPNSWMNYIRDACFKKAGITINYDWD
jgi:RecA/RadA recombinase